MTPLELMIHADTLMQLSIINVKIQGLLWNLSEAKHVSESSSNMIFCFKLNLFNGSYGVLLRKILIRFGFLIFCFVFCLQFYFFYHLN
jgi:hypothetical protein